MFLTLIVPPPDDFLVAIGKESHMVAPSALAVLDLTSELRTVSGNFHPSR
jgi:hypothetical protein